MTKLNRRRFIQATSAVGAAALMPTMPAFAAARSGSASPSQMLWASLHSKADNALDFARTTAAMGVSRPASDRIYAKINHA